MAGRRIKGLFLGVPILPEGSHTEGERLRRDGFAYAALSVGSYLSSDDIMASLLIFLCFCATLRLNLSGEPSFKVRLALNIAFTIGCLIDISRGDMSGLALPFAVAVAAYYSLMAFARFDR